MARTALVPAVRPKMSSREGLLPVGSSRDGARYPRTLAPPGGGGVLARLRLPSPVREGKVASAAEPLPPETETTSAAASRAAALGPDARPPDAACEPASRGQRPRPSPAAMSTDEWDSYRRDSTFSGGFPVAASTMPAAAAAAPCVDLPAGPPPECAILDEPMPVPPDGGAFADPSEAISHLLLPEERPVASFEVRFGVPPLSCWSYVFRPELCCCPLATRSRPGRGLLVVTTSNRVIEWRYAGSEGCCASASSASVRSAPLHSLVHAQVLRAARPITALERCAGLMACSVRAPAAAGLVLTFGSVAASASASALAAAVTGLPAAVSAKADLASFTATAAFAAGAPPLAAASAFLYSAWAAFSAALAPLLAILGFLPAILATLTGGLLDCAKPTGAAGSARHPQVITIVSTEADLMNAEGRGQGVDSTGATDSGFASLVALQHRLLAVKAAAANLSLGRAGGAAALRAATTAGAHGDG